MSTEGLRRLVLSQPLPARLIESLRRAPLVDEAAIFGRARLTGPDAVDRTGALTDPERNMLRALAAGLRISEAADVLGIPYETARDHLRRARRVLAAKNTTHAVALALRRGDIQ
jgi:DNA-binding CsgD family transcriptional regulator